MVAKFLHPVLPLRQFGRDDDTRRELVVKAHPDGHRVTDAELPVVGHRRIPVDCLRAGRLVRNAVVELFEPVQIVPARAFENRPLAAVPRTARE